ncbi:MAG TPA: transporter [Albitalea sp.]|uniref:transporter n=1 Tax=Piscinibacter sp. TaxID=1903157 RepID=UPI002ED03682
MSCFTFTLRLCLSFAALALSAAHAQDAAAPPPAAASSPASSPAASTEAAREALGKKEGDVDQAKVLKDTLSATDKQYSLLKAGKRALTYDLTYSYIGQQLISASFTDQTLTQFAIQNTRGHTVTNTISADYGVRDNLTANLTVPLVSKYSQSETFSGLSNGIGDISLGARFQPFALSRTLPALTATGTLRLATGRSPFKTIEGQGLATGAGYHGVTLGVNASKVIDPVAIFGSLNTTLGLPVKHLSQTRNGQTLREVHPGPSVGFGIGFAYALSYNISTTLSFQESISARTRLKLVDANGNNVDTKTSSQSSAMVNLGLGVRVSPVTTMNFTVGIGLTTDTPDFTVGMNMPLHF